MTTPAPDPCTILLVDDDTDIRETYGEILEDQGYQVVMARDGLEALEYLENAAPLPDLILLDLMMPRMDGPQFRQRQRATERFSDIPVVVISATQMRGTTAAQALAPVGVLKKPLGLDELIRTVEMAVGPAGSRR
jgi:two-component system response regulator MprA